MRRYGQKATQVSRRKKINRQTKQELENFAKHLIAHNQQTSKVYECVSCHLSR